MGKKKRFKKINLVIDAVGDSMWSVMCAPIFKKYVGSLAIHIGSQLKGQRRDEWLTEVSTQPWVAKTSLDGEPKWKPNAYIFDIGRRIEPTLGHNRDTTRIRRLRGVPAVVCFADDHQHHFGGNKAIGNSFIRYSQRFDRIFLRQYCALQFYDQSRVKWFPHNTWSHKNCSCTKLEEPKVTYDIVFPGRIVGPHRQQYGGDAYGAQRIELMQGLTRYDVNYSQHKLNQCQYLRMINTGKIVFNCTGTPYDLNKRVMEGLAAKGMLITNNNTEHSGLLRLFEHKKHLIVYNNQQELHHYINYYLKHDDEREAIARAGQEAVKAHTEEVRALQILAEIYDLIK